MTDREIKNTSLVDLISCVDKAKDKVEINSIIYELACRTYVPFSGVNFDDLLLQYGYQISKEEQEKQHLTR